VSAPDAVTRLAPAKVNLWLDVGARGADGYHAVDTVMLALDRCDRLTARATSGGDVRLAVDGPCATPDVPADERNLAHRGASAVLALARARGLPEIGLELTLEKFVPSRAGLGGGSADAAAAVDAACALVGIAADDDALPALLADLGADCSFFHAARATGLARCTGRGERVEPLPAASAELAFAVVTPDVTCATAEVYAAHRPDERRAPRSSAEAAGLLDRPLAELRRATSNDLERAALRAFPALAAWRALLDERCAESFRLCGSGSSFYGIFDGREPAEAAVRDLAAAVKARDLGLRASFVAAPAGFGLRSATTPA
jgi:4-diphosphocytidyl-2-C-methyl-D-erythritol kinase